MSTPLWEYLEQKLTEHPRARLEDAGHTMTFVELRDTAKALGALLARRVPAGCCCGVLCGSELNAGVLMLALFSAGVTAVPLSKRYGKLHCQKILRKTQPCVLLTDDDKLREFLNTNIPVVLINEISTMSSARTAAIDPQLLGVAAVMCTSGTTGDPKGIMLTYENLLSNLRDIERYFLLGPKDRILILRPLYHAAVLTGEFLLAVAKGASILFCGEEFMPGRLLDQIGARRVTALCATPTLLSLLCRNAARRGKEIGLGSVAVSGECMTPWVWETLSRSLSGAAIYHVYGLTEASPRVSYGISSGSSQPLSAGGPLHSVRLALEDASGGMIERGEGELLVRGPNVMKGYLNDPEATARALRGGWLHTGDIARIDGQGRLFLLGRRDHLIIRAGMNIYPQEIENALLATGAVREVMAWGALGPKGRQQILLKAVPAREGCTPEQLLALCRQVLPDYQVPDRIELAGSLPKNGSGKLLRPAAGR